MQKIRPSEQLSNEILNIRNGLNPNQISSHRWEKSEMHLSNSFVYTQFQFIENY